jgi:hypothetical protein
MIVPPKGPMKRRARYTAPALCIFCQKLPGTTDEHIIPRGIGGNLVITNGTCVECLSKIAPFESSLINNDFEAARVFLEIPSKTKKKRYNLSIFKPVDPNDHKVLRRKYTSSEEHTGIVPFINYPPPGIESNRSFSERFPNGFGITLKCFVESSREGHSLMHSSWDDLKFPRLLAKIAHCYWVAENGPFSASFVLPKYIFGERVDGLGYFLGGYQKTGVPGEDLHFIHHGINTIRGAKWGFADIGLFANYGPQTNYRVYVGLILS